MAWKSWSRNLGIDLGTANILVYAEGQGIVLREPSVVAVEARTQRVLAIGEEAHEMVGRTPGGITAVRPLADGVIAGSTLVLHRAIRNMITLAKMPPETVIPMATSTPADSVGAKGYGRIEPGACGVLTLMDADWNLAGVIA